MKDSAEKISYIVEYITTYEAKIKSLNKLGLFDTATLYEIFAQKICEAWFKQRFINLNIKKSNYPYVDLISEDSKLYVQVSTAQDVHQKIKSTLEKIKDSRDDEFKSIQELYFFVLSNDSIRKVCNYLGESKIGNIEFEKSNNLITTTEILEKVKNDINFQNALYDLFKNESESISFIEEKLGTAISNSKALLGTNIDYYINEEYIIDRTKTIEQIKRDGFKFISIQGEAGSGKSALCKLMVENEKILLYARAEKISESNSIEDIWGLDLNKAVKYLRMQRVVIYIDALEFIADCSKTKLDLLELIYETIKNNDNIFVITSCRTCDRTAFAKIESMYNIKSYDVSLLTDEQIISIGKQYKIINELWNLNMYTQLLRIPFYINLIIKHINNIKEIKNVENFRNLIWTDIMCLKGKTLPNGISNSDVKNNIEKIVFGRAKKFLTGIRIDELDEDIIHKLLSENIVVLCSNNTIRLKYDIYEDICFERFIDSKFDECRNDYNDFFLEIEKMGRCIYRRYQIWVENKLFTKENRNKFIYKLLEKDLISDNWRNHTIVGIAKSNFCIELFNDYGENIPDKILYEFIINTNRFAFKSFFINSDIRRAYSNLSPVGACRPCLIKIIFKKGIYKDFNLEKEIFKLCSDYSQSDMIDDEASNNACEILEYYIIEKLKEYKQNGSIHTLNEINACLRCEYRMAKYSHDWIKKFWKDRIQSYIHDKSDAELNLGIFIYALKNTVPALVTQLPEVLCEIANVYWVKELGNDENEFPLFSGYMNNSKTCGLSKQAENYKYEFRDLTDNSFYIQLVKYNWVVALRWLISLTNYVATYMKEHCKDEVYDINLLVDFNSEIRNYICCQDYWLVGIQENRVHELISDGVYLFTKMAINTINSKLNNREEVIMFAESVKKIIIQETNNVMMLSIIAEIGRNCEEILPSYSLFLASSIDLIILDVKKKCVLFPNEEVKKLENQILMSVGIPYIKNRYDINKVPNDSLQNIVIKLQLLGGKYKEKAEQILDYLYSIIQNTEKDAVKHLQIQKMDIRNASLTQLPEGSYILTPQIIGEAKKITDESCNNEYNNCIKQFQKIADKYDLLTRTEKFDLQGFVEIINELWDLINNNYWLLIAQELLIKIIAFVLIKDNITKESRSLLSKIWLDVIDRVLNNETFVFDECLLKILYNQLDKDIDILLKSRMKKQMLECILYSKENGIINKISHQIKQYLLENSELANRMFNTIVAISEDEMSYFKHNSIMLKKTGNKFINKPNRNKLPILTEDRFNVKGINNYHSTKEEIVENYLISNKKYNLFLWNIKKCNIQTLYHISNCGLNFENKEFKKVMIAFFEEVLRIVYENKDYHKYLDAYAIGEIEDFIYNSLIRNIDVSEVLDLLFKKSTLKYINSNIIKIYNNISYRLLAAYFDAYKNVEIRKQCEKVLTNIEKRILMIKNKEMRHNLCSMLFLTLGQYHMRNWNDLQTKYSYSDKDFLSNIWSRYGYLYFKELLLIVDQMYVSELLPEVIIPLNESLSKYISSDQCESTIVERRNIVNEIITTAFLNFNDAIKSDVKLTEAFENFLNILIEFNVEEAAVILDEFMIH